MATNLSFYTPGKIMLTGEYTVLYGARSIAVPIRLGQQMEVNELEFGNDSIEWVSQDNEGEFFRGVFHKQTFDVMEASEEVSADFVSGVLKGAKLMNPEFLSGDHQVQVHCNIEFSRNFGFGSSSTLICNIAKWAKVDALELNKQVSSGSGYDVAVGMLGTPIIYQLVNNKPESFKIELNYSFSDKLWLVYLGHKQSTAGAILSFKPDENLIHEKVKEINALTNSILEKKTLYGFQKALRRHEKSVSGLLEMPRVRKQLFADFNGEVKSLGAWGGDFVLAASGDNPNDVKRYFNSRGYHTIYPFNDLVVLNKPNEEQA